MSELELATLIILEFSCVLDLTEKLLFRFANTLVRNDRVIPAR